MDSIGSDSAHLRCYTHAQPYSSKAFLEPPRKVIPPPNLDFQQGRPLFTVTKAAPFEYGNNDYGTTEFLRSIVASGALRFSHAMLAWKYEMRRSAQHILPFLLLGPSTAARDAKFIQEAGITFLIAVRSASAARIRPHYLNPTTFATAVGIGHLIVDLDNSYDMRRIIKPTVKAMNDHLEASCKGSLIHSHQDIPGKILVFCESGNERSTTLVAAYLMIVYGVDVVTAIQMIQSQRFCIAPEDGMKDMLAELGLYLEAERQVALAKATLRSVPVQRALPTVTTLTAVTPNKSSKRNMDDAFESDDDPNNVDWDTRNRSGVAPFGDSIT